MRHFSANYIYPVIDKPIKNGIITVNDDAAIVEISSMDNHQEKASMEFHSGILVPGFVNAHCHLELSHLKGKLSRGSGLAGFISQIRDNRFVEKPEVDINIKRALSTLESLGVVAVGDICNTTDTIPFKLNSKIKFHNFIEVFGLASENAERIINRGVDVFDSFEKCFQGSNSITPHSTYSLSTKLWEHLSSWISNQNGPISVHFGESQEEYSLLENKTGELANSFLQQGIRIDLPDKISPLKLVSNYLSINNNILFIHNTFVSKEEIETIKNIFRNPYFVLCPSSNLFIENALPNLKMFIDNGVNLAIGTDSYSSSPTLSVFDQVMIILDDFPKINFQEALKWATLNGAKALNFDKDLGSFEIGKKPGINLITDFDFLNMRPTSKSQVKKIL